MLAVLKKHRLVTFDPMRGFQLESVSEKLWLHLMEEAEV
jgi:hypothetical protein